MIINVKNLGIVANGAVDSSKPLMLLCGPNSTGKTYLSYLLYAVFTNQYRISPACFQQISTIINDKNEFQLKKEYIDEFLVAEADAIKSMVNSIYGLAQDADKRLFRYFKLQLSVSDDFFAKDIVNGALKMNINIADIDVSIQKEAKATAVKFEILGPNGPVRFLDIPLSEYLIFSVLRACAHEPIMGARMLTVERNSIYTFNKELSLSRNELVDRLQGIKKNDMSLMDTVLSLSERYPLAIRDSLKVANDLEQVQKRKSPYYEFATQIEAELLHGTIGVNKTGAVEFRPNTAGRQVNRLPIHMSSSIVKTLSSLIMYLKHLARKNDLVIIDEPEMNLHPDNQRLLARVFARLVNRGLRLVISTHSDYVVREFNNLIMAHQLMSAKKLSRVEGVPYDKSELLDQRKVDVLYFAPGKKGKVEIENVAVDKFGFSVKSMDDTIDVQNEITQTLYESLEYGIGDE